MSLFLLIKEKYNNSRFIRSFLSLAIGEIGARCFNIFTNIILARYLAPERYGLYSYLLTYIAIFEAVASLGLRQLLIREIARHPESTKLYLSVSGFWRVVGVVLSLIIFIIFQYIIGETTSGVLFILLFVAIISDSIWDMFQNVALGLQRLKITSIINVVSAGMILLIYIFLPREYINVENVLLILVLSYLLRDIVYYLCLNKNGFFTGSYDFNIKNPLYKTVLKDSFPFYVLVLFGLFTNQFPIVFLKMNSGETAVAFFNTANKILLPMTLLFNTALAAFFPNQAILFQKDKVAFGCQIKKAITLIILMGTIVCFCISLFRTELVSILYGEAYRTAGNVIAYQCWYFVLFAIFSINGSVLGAANQQKKLSYLSIIYAIVSTPILYLFSYKGAEGVAIGYIVASIINLFIIYPNIIKVSVGQVKTGYSLLLFAALFIFMLLSLFIPQSLSIYIRLGILGLIICSIYINKSHIKRYWNW